MNSNIVASKEPLWTIKDILNWTTERFIQSGSDTPRLDAQLLLGHVLGLTRIQLYMDIDKPLTKSERTQFRELVKRRIAGEPVAYLLNEKYWYDLKLYVDSNVLIPRPETESLLDQVLFYVQNASISPKVIVDICTGSGCLAIALAKKFPQALVYALEISEKAIEIAELNSKQNNVDNIKFFQVDMLSEDINEFFSKNIPQADIVVSNPPYVTTKEWEELSLEVKNYEPKIALVSGEEGLDIAKKIISLSQETSFLSENSILALELSHKQPQELLKNEIPVFNLLDLSVLQQQYDFICHKDYESKERFLFKLKRY